MAFSRFIDATTEKKELSDSLVVFAGTGGWYTIIMDIRKQ